MSKTIIKDTQMKQQKDTSQIGSVEVIDYEGNVLKTLDFYSDKEANDIREKERDWANDIYTRIKRK